MTSRFAINPPDEDRYAVNPDHEADTTRQEQWDIFVASLRDHAADKSWNHVVTSMAVAYIDEWSSLCSSDIAAFAATYGWPDTLTAIAAAMRADEQAKQEAMDRR